MSERRYISVGSKITQFSADLNLSVGSKITQFSADLNL
jgi:hypothetical protein